MIMSHSSGGIAAEARLLRELWRMNLRALVADRGAFWTQAGFMAFNNLMFAATWVIFFSRFEEIGGFALRDVFQLQGMVSIAFGCFVVFCGGGRDLSRRIGDGALDVWLSQPRAVLVQAVGCRTQASGWGDMATGILLLAWGGGLATPQTALMAAIGVLTGWIAFTAIGVGYGALACWFADSDALMRQIFDFTLTFSLWPERIFGGWLRVVLYTVLPAGFVSYVPIAAVREASLPMALAGLGGAAGLLAVAAWILGRGLRRYESGSGFVGPAA
jgi:ABC-2 type transport system permease protein